MLLAMTTSGLKRVGQVPLVVGMFLGAHSPQSVNVQRAPAPDPNGSYAPCKALNTQSLSQSFTHCRSYLCFCQSSRVKKHDCNKYPDYANVCKNDMATWSDRGAHSFGCTLWSVSTLKRVRENETDSRCPQENVF